MANRHSMAGLESDLSSSHSLEILRGGGGGSRHETSGVGR